MYWLRIIKTAFSKSESAIQRFEMFLRKHRGNVYKNAKVNMRVQWTKSTVIVVISKKSISFIAISKRSTKKLSNYLPSNISMRTPRGFSSLKIVNLKSPNLHNFHNFLCKTKSNSANSVPFNKSITLFSRLLPMKKKYKPKTKVHPLLKVKRQTEIVILITTANPRFYRWISANNIKSLRKILTPFLQHLLN